MHNLSMYMYIQWTPKLLEHIQCVYVKVCVVTYTICFVNDSTLVCPSQVLYAICSCSVFNATTDIAVPLKSYICVSVDMCIHNHVWTGLHIIVSNVTSHM